MSSRLKKPPKELCTGMMITGILTLHLVNGEAVGQGQVVVFQRNKGLSVRVLKIYAHLKVGSFPEPAPLGLVVVKVRFPDSP
jgi:hypothetical protein